MSQDSFAEVSRDHFSTLVADWSHVGPPLRPTSEDTAVVQGAIEALGSAPRVVVLGLTPEIIGCTWPAATDLSAIDHSAAMIRALWRADGVPAHSQAIQADWRRMPFAQASVDLVAGDGCYIVLSHPEGFVALTREVSRILRPGGRFVIRVFLRPDRTESIAEIAAALGAGSIGSVHALKLRLLAALHACDGSGTRHVDVWNVWKTLPSPPPGLLGTRGWTPEEIAGIERYRDLKSCFYLPTLDQTRTILQSAFTELECVTGAYELGERCPTFVLSRNAGS
jgi:SAM-dependent methyltransferase